MHGDSCMQHAGHVCAQGQCVQATCMSRSRAPLSPLPPRMPTLIGALDSSLVDMLEHVEDEHRPRLLLRHVLLKVLLQCLQLQEDLEPPPLVEYGQLLLHEPVSCHVSCVHLVVSEQQQQLGKTALHFLSTLCNSMCRGICAAGAA